jgi:hypothetical protein
MVAIIIMASSGSDLLEDADDAGVRHVLLKPIAVPCLLALVEGALSLTNGGGPGADESSSRKDQAELPAGWNSVVTDPAVNSTPAIPKTGRPNTLTRRE